MHIGSLKKFSLIDYPGKMAAVIFTKGCNFRCPYCFNPELVFADQFGVSIPERVVFSFLKKRRGVLEGVVVTGGEPTVHTDLPDFLKRIKELGYFVKLDTNGSHPEMLEEIIDIKAVDYIAMDIKAPWAKYDLLTGVANSISLIKESISVIKGSGVDYEFRTTAVKSLLSSRDLQQISSYVKKADRYVIQPFMPSEKIINNELLKKKRFTDDEILRFQRQWGRG